MSDLRIAVRVDGDERAVDATVAALVAEHGPIDGLVNNAGGQFVQPAAQMSPNGWRTVIDLNLNASVNPPEVTTTVTLPVAQLTRLEAWTR